MTKAEKHLIDNIYNPSDLVTIKAAKEAILIALDEKRTVMNKPYESASILLRHIWYAQKHLNDTVEEIDWAGIDESASQIVPSSSEEALVSFSKTIVFWAR